MSDFCLHNTAMSSSPTTIISMMTTTGLLLLPDLQLKEIQRQTEKWHTNVFQPLVVHSLVALEKVALPEKFAMTSLLLIVILMW